MPWTPSPCHFQHPKFCLSAHGPNFSPKLSVLPIFPAGLHGLTLSQVPADTPCPSATPHGLSSAYFLLYYSPSCESPFSFPRSLVWASNTPGSPPTASSLAQPLGLTPLSSVARINHGNTTLPRKPLAAKGANSTGASEGLQKLASEYLPAFFSHILPTSCCLAPGVVPLVESFKDRTVGPVPLVAVQGNRPAHIALHTHTHTQTPLLIRTFCSC